ncbi:ABC transporter permease [Maribellus maritimus]|uniref:ABC transporter permease n=1 Tax=Maribellus maritimus TaxID=2870838 RepID=UPI001EEC4F97|nr:ABC transporter permease [Maribellus maritimus]MCG6188032.1 ABC transporter permease [Maribellus maritimus]
MIKNYLKTAVRSLLKSKLFSIINLSGLAIGMASFIIIVLYVGYERSYDKFYKNYKNIYRVYMDYIEKGELVPGDAQAYNLAGPTMKENIPEVVDFIRFFQLYKTSFEFNNKVYEIENGHLADPSFFHLFTPYMQKGNQVTALNEPNTIVLTESSARKIFGQSDPVGKTIKAFYNGANTTLRVTGVIKDIPKNTHLKINFLVSYSTYKDWRVFNPQTLNWSNNNTFTYLLAKEGVAENELRQKIFELDVPIKNERQNIEPLADIHLYSDKPYEAETNGNASSVRFLFAISVFIILLSWLNYINLASAKMMERTKEVGIRKVAGARKIQLVSQFVSESFLLNFAAFFISLGLTLLILPFFNSFVGKELSLRVIGIGQTLILIGIPLAGIFLSGLYPSIVLSSFAPVKILKGKLTGTPNKLSFRKGIVTVQFLATIILLTGTITILKQLKFMSDIPLGMNLNQTISIKSTIIDKPENSHNSFRVLKAEVEKLSFVENVSLAQTYPGEGYDNMSTFSHITFPDGTKDEHTNWFNFEVDEDYIPLMEFKILAGYNFSGNEDIDKNRIIINEHSARLMGFTDLNEAVGKEVNFWGRSFQIAAVVKDYHHFGLKNEVKPFIIRYSPNEDGLIVKLKSNSASIAEIDKKIEILRKEWGKVFTQSTFHYNFIDKKFASLYNEEKKFSEAFTIFTFLAIFIATLGLFGLSYYRTNQRIKEIGIRKVNGAKISEILSMLNKDFVKWVAIAFVIATPIAYYAMHKWLENFAYKTTLSWWIFALAGLLALGIALLTVSWQSWRAATRNPVEALRYE